MEAWSKMAAILQTSFACIFLNGNLIFFYASFEIKNIDFHNIIEYLLVPWNQFDLNIKSSQDFVRNYSALKNVNGWLYEDFCQMWILLTYISILDYMGASIML